MKTLCVSNLCAAMLATTSCLGQTGPLTLSSPDGRLSARFSTVTKAGTDVDGGRLVYAVSYEGKQLVDRSGLSLSLDPGEPLGVAVRIAAHASFSAEDRYRLVTGKTASVDERYNALHIDLEETETSGRKMVLEARAYNDAIAFRYTVPQQAALQEFRLAHENTEFRISRDPYVYALVLPHLPLDV